MRSRTLLALLVSAAGLVGLLQACVGDSPSGGGGEGDDDASVSSSSGGTNGGSTSGGSSSSGDSGVSVLDPDAAPPAGCPLGCLPPAPSGWTGPSAVYDGAVAGKPADCPQPYTLKEVDLTRGATASAATCTCAPGTPSGASCSAAWAGHAASGCGDPAFFEGDTGDACAAIEHTSTVSYFKPSVTADFTNAVCAFSAPSKTLPAVAFDAATVACGLPQVATCESRPDCAAVPAAGAQYTRLCVHKPGDVSCPSADYGVRFVSYHAVDDQRGCSDCSGAATGTCDVVLTNTPGCVGGAVIAPDACVPYKAYGRSYPNYSTCAGTSAGNGAVADADPETFCCNK